MDEREGVGSLGAEESLDFGGELVKSRRSIRYPDSSADDNDIGWEEGGEETVPVPAVSVGPMGGGTATAMVARAAWGGASTSGTAKANTSPSSDSSSSSSFC